MKEVLVNTEKYYKIVEDAIRNLGVAPESCRVADQEGKIIPGQWNLKKGSAQIYADVYHAPEGTAYFCVASPVVETLFSSNAKLYEKLLMHNHRMFAAAFSIYDGKVWLRIVRECEGMDAEECRKAFDRVGGYADQFDDEIKKEFGS